MSFASEAIKKYIEPVVKFSYPTDVSDVTLFWRTDSAVLHSTYDHSAGTLATFIASSALVTTNHKIGTYCLNASGSGTNPIPSAGIYNRTKGRFGCWVFPEEGSLPIFSVYNGSMAPLVTFGIYSGGDLLRATDYAATTSSLSLTEANALAFDVWSFVEYAWDSVAGNREIYINGELVGSITGEVWTPSAASYIIFGPNYT